MDQKGGSGGYGEDGKVPPSRGGKGEGEKSSSSDDTKDGSSSAVLTNVECEAKTSASSDKEGHTNKGEKDNEMKGQEKHDEKGQSKPREIKPDDKAPWKRGLQEERSVLEESSEGEADQPTGRLVEESKCPDTKTDSSGDASGQSKENSQVGVEKETQESEKDSPLSNGAGSGYSTDDYASDTTTSTYLSEKIPFPRSKNNTKGPKSSNASPTDEESTSSTSTPTSNSTQNGSSSTSSGSFVIDFIGTSSSRSSSSASTSAITSSSSSSVTLPKSQSSTDTCSVSTSDTGISQDTSSIRSQRSSTNNGSSFRLSLSRVSDENDHLSRESSRIESYEHSGSNGSGYVSSIESNTGSTSPQRDDNRSNGPSDSRDGSTNSDESVGIGEDVNGNNRDMESDQRVLDNGNSNNDPKGNNGNDNRDSDNGDHGDDEKRDDSSRKSDDTTTTTETIGSKNPDESSIGGSNGSSSSFHISNLFKSRGESYHQQNNNKTPSDGSSSGSYRLGMLYSPKGSTTPTSQVGDKGSINSRQGSMVGILNLFSSSGGGSEANSVKSGSDASSLGSYGRTLFRTSTSASSGSRSGSTASLGSYGRRLFGSYGSDPSSKGSDKGSLGSYGRKLFRGSSSESSSGKASDISSLGSYCRRLFSTPSTGSSSESSVTGGSKGKPDSNDSSLVGSVGRRKCISKSSSSGEETPMVAGVAILSSVNGQTAPNAVNGSSSRSSASNGLSWITITPAQSPIQPIMEVFPPPQVPVMTTTVHSPQTPLISTITPSYISQSTLPKAKESPEEERKIEIEPKSQKVKVQEEHLSHFIPEESPTLERTESYDTVRHKSYHDSSTTMGSSSDNLEASEHQPLLDSTYSGVDHTFILSGIEAADRRTSKAASNEIIDHSTRPMLETLPQQDTTNYLISPAGFVTSHGHRLGSPGLGHSSGLVPLQLSGPHDNIASYPLAGQGLLTTVHSIDYTNSVPLTQPVLAPLQLPQQVLASPVAVTDSTLMAPAIEDLPSLSETGVMDQAMESSPTTVALGHPLSVDTQPTDCRVLEDVPETGPTRPNRNLHLDLGWVWGQDATKMQAARPKRHRIRKAQAMPISPHVGPLSAPDMDTADSGLGTADGDMMFGAPYSSELPTSADITANTQTNFMLSDKWKSLFDKYDPEGQGEVSVDNFRALLDDVRFQSQVAPHKLEVLENLAGNGRTTVTYHDLVSIMSNKRRRSFTIAVHCRDREVASESDFHLEAPPPGLFARMVRRIAKEFLTDERDRQYYADHYTCWPPPLFVPTVTLVEIGFFVYYCVEAGDIGPASPVPANSMFIYRPDKRIEIWRFFFYMLIHAGWVHLFFNMLVQLLVGIPLEMVHGSFRIGTVYMAGVLAGSLGTSVFDMDAFLVGASGGVYALLAAHLANILLNYSEMELGIFKLVAVFMIASADVGFAIWDRYSSEDAQPPVGYVSHLMGALAGLTIGLLVLKNFQQKLHTQILWWIALGVYSICTLFAILWNIFYY